MPMTHVNALAAVVAAVLAFALGMLWYSPVLFAKQWMAAQGITPEAAAQARTKGMFRAYAVSFLCYLVMAHVVALFVSYMQIETFAQGLWLGFLAWLGLAAPIGLTANMFSTKPIAAWVIDAGYQLASLLIMGVILALWH